MGTEGRGDGGHAGEGRRGRGRKEQRGVQRCCHFSQEPRTWPQPPRHRCSLHRGNHSGETHPKSVPPGSPSRPLPGGCSQDLLWRQSEGAWLKTVVWSPSPPLACCWPGTRQRAGSLEAQFHSPRVMRGSPDLSHCWRHRFHKKMNFDLQTTHSWINFEIAMHLSAMKSLWLKFSHSVQQSCHSSDGTG